MWEFDEAVEVRSDVVDGVETPEQFLWRGRLWRVCSVQAHWTETAAWWERGIIGAGLGAGYDGRPGPARTQLNGVAAPASPHSRTDRVAAHAPGGSIAALAPAGSAIAEAADPAGISGSPASVGVLDADWGPRRAVYRVEAGCGRHGRRELFDLAHDPDSGRWQLERVTDR